ncbi:MAG: restriction endonuclease subunit S [Ardenticatenales bacterium]|nr:restriction endonuclease subunit S [Ardenticatenales bacterium]
MKTDWSAPTIGELCDVIAGQSPEGSFYNADGVGMPFYQGKKSFGEKFIEAPTTWTTQVTKTAHNGDILMSVRAPVGPVNFATETICIGRGLAAIHCGSRISREFLFLQLLHLQSEISGVEGAVFASISKSAIESLHILVPPLPEQHRIVRLLDEAFAGIATANANAERNRENARAVFESHLQSAFTRDGAGWGEMLLSDVAENVSTGPFGTMLHKSDYVSDGIPLVNPMNIVDSRIVPSPRMMVNEETRRRLSGYALKIGDIVIGRRGDLGRCALVTKREEGWLCGTGSFFVRLSSTMDGEFFVALFGSNSFKARLERSAVGTTMSSLNHDILNNLVLPVPPLDTQRAIMMKVHELLGETQHLAELYERKLAALDALKKSLLHHAFTGQL